MRSLIFFATVSMLVMSIAAVPYPSLPSLEGSVGNHHRVERANDSDIISRLVTTTKYLEIFDRLGLQGGLDALSPNNRAEFCSLYRLGDKQCRDDFSELVENKTGRRAVRLSESYPIYLKGIPSPWMQYEILVRSVDRIPFIYDARLAKIEELRPVLDDAFCNVYALTLEDKQKKNPLAPPKSELNDIARKQLSDRLELDGEEARRIIASCDNSVLAWWVPQDQPKEEKEDKEEKEEKEEKKGGRIRSFFKYILAIPSSLVKKLLELVGLSSKGN